VYYNDFLHENADFKAVLKIKMSFMALFTPLYHIRPSATNKGEEDNGDILKSFIGTALVLKE
jgi:hypothetical protein